MVTSAGKLSLVQVADPDTERVLSSKPALRRGWTDSEPMPKQPEWIDYVVGWALTARRNAPSHAFLWHSSTGMRDLNVLKSTTDTSGVELTSAAKINNAGQILALGASKSLGNVAVLLNPQ